MGCNPYDPLTTTNYLELIMATTKHTACTHPRAATPTPLPLLIGRATAKPGHEPTAAGHAPKSLAAA
jgi:hypothetical protein